MENDDFVVNVNGYEGLHSILSLGDGEYKGMLSGYRFRYKGEDYYSEIGVRCPFPIPCIIFIKDGKQVRTIEYEDYLKTRQPIYDKLNRVKFRGISFETFDWIYGYPLNILNNYFILDPLDFTHNAGKELIQVNKESKQVYKETVSQFIGMTDIDHKEIYEGDIVEFTFEIGVKRIGYVTFLQQELGYVVVFDNFDKRLGHRNNGSHYYQDTNLKVIGNLFENKDLIPWMRKN